MAPQKVPPLQLLLLVVAAVGHLASPCLAQFPGDRLPIEEVSLTDIYKACEVPIAAEVLDGDIYPPSLESMGVAGTWGYEQTNHGVVRNPSLLSNSGKIDLWVSNDSVTSNLGLMHDVSAILYLTGDAARNDALESTVMVRARGQYVPSKGLLCLLGCQEALLPTIFSNSGNGTGAFAGGDGVDDGVDGVDLIDEPEAPLEGENVEAGVANPIPISQQMETQCRTRIVLRFSLKDEGSTEASVSGRLESLRRAGEPAFFSPMAISASTGPISAQIAWFRMEMIVESTVCAVQAALVALLILNVRRSPEGAYVSLTMVLVQAFVYAFYWVRSLYWPLRYFNSEVLLYFLSDVANIPRSVEFIIFVLYVYLAVLVDTKRRPKTPRSKSAAARAAEAADDVEVAGLLGSGPASTPSHTGPGAAERQLAMFFWPIYVVVAVCMWFSYDFDTFLRESTFLFLTPQVFANYLWDPPDRALRVVHIGYAIGNTVAQMIWLAYEVLRPRLMGYDAFFAFPHTWYWSSMFLMVAQLGLFVGQRLKGGSFNKPLLMLFPPESLPSPSRSTEMTSSTTLTGMVRP